MRRRATIAGLVGVGAMALVLSGCQGQGAFAAIQEKLSGIADQQTQILTKIDQLETTIKNMPAAPAGKPAGPKGPQPGKPDPKATYKVALTDAQTKGPADAKITIVEWSDFQ